MRQLVLSRRNKEIKSNIVLFDLQVALRKGLPPHLDAQAGSFCLCRIPALAVGGWYTITLPSRWPTTEQPESNRSHGGRNLCLRHTGAWCLVVAVAACWLFYGLPAADFTEPHAQVEPEARSAIQRNRPAGIPAGLLFMGTRNEPLSRPAAIDSPPPPGPKGPNWHLQNCRLPCSQVSHCSGTPHPSSPFYQPAGLCCFFILPGTTDGTRQP